MCFALAMATPCKERIVHYQTLFEHVVVIAENVG